MSESRQHERSLFLDALDIESSEAREAFLDGACGDDAELRARLDRLLQAANVGNDFLDPGHYAALERERASLNEELVEECRFLADVGPRERTIGGDYELIEEIGRGSMGVVFRAHQRSLNREVAVKVILGSALASAGARDRFRAEAESAAALKHANIVPIYEVGRQGHFDFYSMALVPGGTLAQRIDAGPTDPRDAVRLMTTVTRTIQAAHRHGIIHRDLKPENILLDDKGEPCISDFGLACRLERSGGLTLTGQILGTPQYMAPEQIAGGSGAATIAVDIYSLGVVLYELLAGEPPIRGDSVLGTLQQVREAVPPPLRTLAPGVDRDLDTIVMRCLEKTPDARYASAEALADDLEAWRDRRPIAARPPSVVERTSKWVRRRPVHAALAGTVGVLLLILGIGGPYVAWRETDLREQADAARIEAERARQTAEEERGRAVDSADLANQRAAANLRLAYASGVRLVETADRFGKQQSLAPQTMLLSWAQRDGEGELRGWEWYYLFGQTHEGDLQFGHEDAVHALQFSPFGDRFLSSNQRGTTIFNTLNRIMSRTMRDGEPHLFSAWSPDGNRIVTLGLSGKATIWNPRTAERMTTLPDDTPYRSVSWGPSGRRLASVDETGALALWRIADAVEPEVTFRHEGIDPEQIAWSPTGRHLAAIGASHDVWVWDIGRLDEPPEVYQGHSANVTSLSWQADGTWLATGSEDNIVRIWGVPGGDRVVNTSPQGGGAIRQIAWNPDGLVLMHGADARDDVIELDLVASAEQTFGTFAGPISALAWSANAHSIAVGNADGRIVVRRIGMPPVSRVLKDQSPGLVSVHWSKDGTSVLCADVNGKVTVFDTVTGKTLRESTLGTSDGWAPHAWSPRGPEAVVIDEGRVRLLSPKGARLAADLDLDVGQAADVSWTAQGRGVLIAMGQGEVRRFDFRPGRSSRSTSYISDDRVAKYGSVSSSPDGRWVLATGKRGRVTLWSAQTRESTLDQGLAEKGHDERVHDWHPDSRHFATGSNRGVVSVWSVEPALKRFEFEAHRGPVGALAWHPSGRRIATAGDNGDIYLWDWELRQNVLTLRGHRGPVADLAWDAEGRRLASVGKDGTLRVWDATAGMLLSSQILTDEPVQGR
ncbi:MAG: protein kinase [Planctomycetota bacterium]